MPKETPEQTRLREDMNWRFDATLANPCKETKAAFEAAKAAYEEACKPTKRSRLMQPSKAATGGSDGTTRRS